MTPSCFVSAIVFSLGALGVTGCNRQGPDTRAADEQAIRTAEIEAVRALNAGDVESYLSTYPQDSYWLPPNSPIVRGQQAIRQLSSQLASNPAFAFEVQPTTVEVSRAGDLAYLVGTYSLTLSDRDGKAVTEHGKYVEVWKKADGVWQHVLAIWNSDEPPPQ